MPTIEPAQSHTAYRRIIDSDGVQLPGQFAMQFIGLAIITDEAATATLPARTVITFGGTIQPPLDTDLVVRNSNGDVVMKIDQDGFRAFDEAGGSPRQTVNAGRAVRDVELEAVLATFGWIEVV